MNTVFSQNKHNSITKSLYADDMLYMEGVKKDMYEENQTNQEYRSTADYYGAVPNTNAAVDERTKKKKSNSLMRKIGTFFACGIAFGLAASLIFVGVIKGSGVMETTTPDVLAEETVPTESANPNGVIGEVQLPEGSAKPMAQAEGTMSISDIVDASMPSIVSITNTGVEEMISMFGKMEYEATSAGSGIIIGQNETELLIATNNHVVSGSNELSVCFGDNEEEVVSAKIKGTDASNDLAIISVELDDLSEETRASIAIAKLGDSDELKVGDQVVAIGNALGYGQSVTTGIVSAKDREVTIDDISTKLIQTDAAINPGNSGGALLNMKGEVIGINSSKFASTKVEGICYAIPISTAQPILEELMLRETRDKVDVENQGYLGISCQNVSADIAEMYHIPIGVYVLGATEGSAADKAGLQKGDIITKFDGTSISDYDELKNILQYYKAGETVELVIERAKEDGGYEEQKVSVTLDRNVAATEASGQEESRRNESEELFPDDLFGGFFGY